MGSKNLIIQERMGGECLTSIHNTFEEFDVKESKEMGLELVGKVRLKECLFVCLFVLKVTEIIACLYAHGDDTMGEEKLMM